MIAVPSFFAIPSVVGLTASKVVATSAGNALVSVATVGSGSVVLATGGLLIDQVAPQTIINGAPLFNVGLKAPYVYPAADSTTAFQVRKANGTDAVVTVDTTNLRLEVIGKIMIESVTTDATAKYGYILNKHYTNAEEPFSLFQSGCTSGNNYINFGGGSGSYNAATYLAFTTAANNTTVEGTERMRIIANGNVGINDTNPLSKLSIIDTTLAGSAALAGSALSIAQTWNTTGSPIALMVNVTDTARGAASRLLSVGTGGASYVEKFGVSNAGFVSIAANGQIKIGSPVANQTGLMMTSSNYFIFSDTLNGADQGASNIINNFNSYIALLIQRSSTGTGNFIDCRNSSSANQFLVNNLGRVGIGGATISAALTLPAGTATASTAPLKLTSGVKLTIPEAGAIEYDGSNLSFTRVAAREIIPTVITKTDTGDPTGAEGTLCINTYDNNVKIYADGGWRQLATW